MRWDCPCGVSNSEKRTTCAGCGVTKERAMEVAAGMGLAPTEPAGPTIPIVTTPSMEGFVIQKYLGIVTAEIVMGVHMFKDLGAQLRDVFGGRAAGYQEELRKGKILALTELSEAAVKQGANAVVGATLDYEAGLGNMLMLIAKGTAVTIAPSTPPAS